MSRELRLFGTWAHLYNDVEIFLRRTNTGHFRERVFEWHDQSDRIKWVVAPCYDTEWRMQIAGMQFSHVTIHTSFAIEVRSEEEYNNVQDNIRYAQSRLRYYS
ncbi:hypothetical protein vB_PsyM_KIL3b_0003 [Pseudomonas phage vB_PsyM_KIL3b]|uniref:Uncharacterized protein n=3 Tax=Pseudomonas phage vB_PsyM_KIL1 TaxID=1777065 RepID=A0A142IFR8_9CAUD|nr:hypothetical protein BH774_gp003 [Pseudomonas phage vB_PsyM_KIL1]AMR57255.1 hypothetical protein vB_PsyM_KIL1_0003 [Pseudomonas phage vB_PsyM_KIL1]AMR57575.1 hypothetical protein vB_PsyM_KIL3_0003 [Pseudomonas phage vB_PsyM_KIL3]AMR58073.1 hypothetical protein vB_PsyM_KIL3b_0003 [Pseudomonas phage vB_PsyM_KIL3b]